MVGGRAPAADRGHSEVEFAGGNHPGFEGGNILIPPLYIEGVPHQLHEGVHLLKYNI